jgi:hypothetical protein
MKKLLILSLIALSATPAFARLCNVEMVSNTGRVLDTFLDRDDDCAEAMRECKTQIRLRGYTRGLADCYLRRPNPAPIPQPIPQPIPRPTDTNPYPIPGRNDARLSVHPGDEIVYFSRKLTVIGTDGRGLISAKDSYGFITNGIHREDLAVTRGCNYDICVGDQIIDISGNRKLSVIGLGYNNTYAGSDTYGFITQSIAAEDAARTNGCVASGYNRICVGNQVVTNFNQYKTVAAIQPDGKVVLQDDYGFLTPNVDPITLVVTR